MKKLLIAIILATVLAGCSDDSAPRSDVGPTSDAASDAATTPDAGERWLRTPAPLVATRALREVEWKIVLR